MNKNLMEVLKRRKGKSAPVDFLEDDEEYSEKTGLAPDGISLEIGIKGPGKPMDEEEAIKMAEGKMSNMEDMEDMEGDDDEEEMSDDEVEMLFGGQPSKSEIEQIKGNEKPRSILERAKKMMLEKKSK